MNPTDYNRLASFEELDRECSEYERTVADTFDEGTFSEDGGTLGHSDWEDALAQ